MRHYGSYAIIAVAAMFCCATACCATADVILPYTKDQNEAIYKLRLAARQFAIASATKKCNWKPASPSVFADYIPPGENAKNDELFRKIMGMLRRDQNTRSVYAAVRTKESLTRVREVDSENLQPLKRIILAYGFPPATEVGWIGANAMLMLVAHADSDVAFQRAVLAKMKDEVTEGRLNAVYPRVLESIRPDITGHATHQAHVSRDHSHNKRPALDVSGNGSASGATCYARAYSSGFDTYIRDHYEKLVSIAPSG